MIPLAANKSSALWVRCRRQGCFLLARWGLVGWPQSGSLSGSCCFKDCRGSFAKRTNVLLRQQQGVKRRLLKDVILSSEPEVASTGNGSSVKHARKECL